MADTLEVRLGGRAAGRPITTGDLDFSEVRPLIDRLESAALIEAGIETMVHSGRRATNREVRPLDPVRLALATVFTPADPREFGAVYRFLVGAEALGAVSKITAGLAGLSASPLVPRAAHAVREGLHRTIRKGLSVQLVNGVTTPVFTTANPPPDLAVYPTRRAESEIAVRVLRVGGKRPVVRVKLLGSGQEATLDLGGEKAARELGNHLYRDAVLKGPAEWVVDPARFGAPTRLLKFKVATYRLLRPAVMDEVIDEMTAATGGAWDDTDPTAPEEVADAPGGGR